MDDPFLAKRGFRKEVGFKPQTSDDILAEVGIVVGEPEHDIAVSTKGALTWHEVRDRREARRSELLAMDERHRKQLDGVYSYKNRVWLEYLLMFCMILVALSMVVVAYAVFAQL